MPAIWSSSQSPISVRMMWVDGVRHVILSEDDPLASRKRPQTSLGVKKKSSFDSTREVNCFEACLVKLRLVTEKKSVSDRGESARIARRQSAPICSRMVRRGSDSVSMLLGNYKDSYECVSRRSTDALEIREITFRLDKETTAPQDTPALIHLDTLSERVLQWLDLSGRVDLVQDNSSEIENFCEEEKSISRCKYEHRDEEEVNGNCMKMIVPTKYLILEEQDRSTDDANDDSKAFYKRKVHKNLVVKQAQDSDESDSSEDEKTSKIIHKTRCDGIEKLWAPPAKPQLHIFMPSLKSTDFQWMSSQESLSFD